MPKSSMRRLGERIASISIWVGLMAVACRALAPQLEPLLEAPYSREWMLLGMATAIATLAIALALWPLSTRVTEWIICRYMPETTRGAGVGR